MGGKMVSLGVTTEREMPPAMLATSRGPTPKGVLSMCTDDTASSPPSQYSHPSTVEIPLTQGLTAIIDAEDLERVSAFKWCVLKIPRKSGVRYYAMTSEPGNNAHKIYLHRLLMDPPDGLVVDHINGDGLDNRRANLRVCTQSQNSCNHNRPRVSQTGFRGVAKHHKKYRATIRTWDGKDLVIGTFVTPEEAARAYDHAAIRHHGEFATLNFPDDVEREAA